ncbi:carotenoid biosynthesis protein [Microbispora cellulosiformans]|uniref:Carotenoid biosynthesis protein n=1 Tax=Microbispora cellulosiformans TaxID=2614688 RepID=A0A5J5JUF1_9ACTN|nr:carotenoid biosynthesis protein [Microbispora cellulosiformans]KAA9374610.1 carotenoid biosynthesis protein [Microbispora cellulosiformans]
MERWETAEKRAAEADGTPPAPRGARRRGWWLNAVGVALLGVMVAAQIATGLRPDDLRLTTVVVVLIAASALAFASAATTPARAAGAFGAAVAAGYAAEWIGTRTGLPFGDYHYTDVLWPRPGGVPLIVALAWGGMGLAAHAVATRAVPGRAVPAHAVATRAVPGRAVPAHAVATRAAAGRAAAGRAAAARAVPYGVAGRVCLGAVALTAWDLFLDPQMLRLGLWVWAEPGPYRGVPLGNFAGWLLVSLLVMTLIERIAHHPAPAAPGTAARAGATGLVALYTVMAVMETVGFAVVFRPPDLLVAAAGGAAMGMCALLAWRGTWRK